MAIEDKLSNTAQDAKGKVNEATGRLTDDQAQEEEGKADQVKADLKDAVEKVKDAFKH